MNADLNRNAGAQALRYLCAGMKQINNELNTNSRRQSSFQFGARRSYVMNCKRATPSVWGNLTGMCLGSNAEVQSSRDNVKKFKNPLWTIC